jgi:uncharacterized protein
MTVILLLIGLAAGILSGVFGIGGGIVIVPSLILLLKMTPQQATATSLAALVLPLGAAVGAYTYYRHGHLQILPAVLIAIGMIGGAFIGAYVAANVDAVVLRRAFAVLLVVMAGKMWVG